MQHEEIAEALIEIEKSLMKANANLNDVVNPIRVDQRKRTISKKDKKKLINSSDRFSAATLSLKKLIQDISSSNLVGISTGVIDNRLLEEDFTDYMSEI
jgi:hypothetical protein